MVAVRFVGAEGGYQSIETQAVRIHASLERWGAGRVKSDLVLLPRDRFRRRGLFRRRPLRALRELAEGIQVLVVVKSSLFHDFLSVARTLRDLCRERGVTLVSNPCDGPGADGGDTRDAFSEEIADWVFALSRMQERALAERRGGRGVFHVGHASRLDSSRRLVPRPEVRRVVWENAVHHNPLYDQRKVGMPKEKYHELEDMLADLLRSRGASLVFIEAWRETQSYEEWEGAMLASDVAIECKALGRSYADYQAQKPAVKVLNYMSLGLPVICDSLPTYRDLGEDGKELLFADTLEEWRAQMTRLLDDYDLRVRLGEAARKAAEPYRIENVARRYVEFFESIAAGPPPGSGCDRAV